MTDPGPGAPAEVDDAPRTIVVDLGLAHINERVALWWARRETFQRALRCPSCWAPALLALSET